MTDSRPLPTPTELSAPFWDGCRQGMLRVQQCRRCQALVFVPRPMCPTCQHTSLDWTDSGGKGSVYSFTVVHRPPRPAFAVPFVVAIIELDEGWYLLSNVIGCDPDAVHVGMTVEVAFTDMDETITLPLFRPV